MPLPALSTVPPQWGGDTPMQPSLASDSGITRRKLLVGSGCLLGGYGAFQALATGKVSAQVSGDFSVTGDSATVGEPPQSITVAADGEYAIDAPAPPEQARLVLQTHVNGSAGDLAEDIQFDSAGGTYSLEADLYSHRNVSRGDLTPDAAGEQAVWDVLLRVILLVVNGGEIQAEDFVEDTAQLGLTRDGFDLTVGGTGSVTINQ